MRLSLRLKLFVLLLLVAAAVVAGTWAFMERAFERGFVRLVETRQRDHVEAVVRMLGKEYARAGWDRLRRDRRRWIALLLEARGAGERTPRWARRLLRAPANARLPGRPFGHEGEADDDGHGRAPPGREGRLPLELRMRLLDGDRHVIVGRPDEVDRLELTPIRVDGREVGYLGVLPGPALNELADIRFVEEQKRAFLLVAAVMVLLAGALAIPLAGAMTGRLREIAQGARALAAGRFETRVPAGSGDELGRLAVDFNELAAALERAERDRRQWVVDISHELRTPLAVLRAELEALQDGVHELDARAVDALHADVMRLGRLVDDLYDLARSDLGALSYHKSDLDPLAVLDDDLAAMAGEFAQRGIQVAVERRPEGRVRVHADATRLSQLFRNLLTNTLRYTDPGGRLRIRASREGGQVVLEFDDSAPGVPAAHVARLFERFHRVERSRSRDHGGAGLGLAICRSIVTAHGGHIDARPGELGGLCIRVTLPEAP